MSSPIEQPEQRAEYYADDNAGNHGKIERSASALEHYIAGQPPETDPRPNRPDNPDDQYHHPEPKSEGAVYPSRASLLEVGEA
jgi:hypothetical protein